MKSKQIVKKLQINKTTISNLTNEQLDEARGGNTIWLTIGCSENDYSCEACSDATQCLIMQ
ncbi:MAG: class I lanthipeptide [Candidatus Aminicenantes bacterium]|nr:class I lanthipeptide [Candidatus Aminicenantes bacterium]